MIDNDNIKQIPCLEGDIVPLQGFIFIETQRDKHTNLEYGSLKLIKDISHDQYGTENATQDGIVRYAYEGCPVIPGDKIYGHHFMCDLENAYDINGVRMYKIHVRSLYCVVRDGEIAMVGHWNFITPIEIEEKTAGGIFIPQFVNVSNNPSASDYKVKSKFDEEKGHITHLSTGIMAKGVNKGDLVWWTKNSDYQMKVEGKIYYRMTDEDIVAVEDKL